MSGRATVRTTEEIASRHPKVRAFDIEEGQKIFFEKAWREIVKKEAITAERKIRLYFQGGYTTVGYDNRLHVYDAGLANKQAFFGMLAVLLILPGSLIWGTIVTKMWEWFFVPVFEVRQMPVVSAAAAVLVFRAVIPVGKKDEGMPDNIAGKLLMVTVIAPAFTLIFLLFLARFV